jgi:hypothetical protein
MTDQLVFTCYSHKDQVFVLQLAQPLAGLIVLLILTIGSYSYFSRPTWYDVYLPFREPYQNLRERLRSIAPIAAQVQAPRPLSAPLDNPYVVVLRPLRLDSKRVDSADIARAGPYRVILFDLTHQAVLFTQDIESYGDSFDTLQAAMNQTLTQIGARIITD